MILPETLWPGMTRHGFTYRTQVPVSARDVDLFPRTKDGLFLPLAQVALRELNGARALVARELKHDAAGKFRAFGHDILAAVEFNDETGCYVPAQKLSEQEHTEALWQIAETDMGGEPLDALEDKGELRVCETQECVNARHYDFTHKKPYRDTLIKPDYRMYETLPDGGIVPHWEGGQGVVLPSVAESIADFIDFKNTCAPFVEAKQSPLTANGISKITVDAVTGCWMVRMYYTRPSEFGPSSFQYDGYGRLGVGAALRTEGERGYQMLAHRVVWRATGGTLLKGRELNHECAVRPCCNPKHLTQVTRSQNILHMQRLSASRRVMRGHIEK